MRALERPKSGNPAISTWIATILVCGYLGWTGFSLHRSTAAFSSLYDSLNAPLPGPTWFVIQYYHGLYPSVFGGASALLITKQGFVRDKWIDLGVTLAAALVFGVVVSAGILRALYLPILSNSLQK